MRAAVTTILVALTAAVVAWSSATLVLGRDGEGRMIALALLVAWVLFFGALLALRRAPDRAVAVLVIGGTVLIGGAGLAGAPNTSTDSARYAWDGIVSNAGLSPYDRVPVDDDLEPLRTDWLFPAPDVAADGAASCGQGLFETTSVPSGEPVCTAINRPQVPTIYPPVAEVFFAAARFFVPAEAQYLPLQVASLLVAVGVSVMLLSALRRRGLDPRWAAVWGWCPLVATEAVNNAHVDVLAAALALGATLLVASGRRVWGGIAMGAAIATKFIPVMAAPPLLRRGPLAVVLAAVATFAGVYVPYLLASGSQVLGYLPGYLVEEGYGDGSRFALLTLVLPGPVATPVAAVLLAVAAGLAIWKTDPARPWMTQVVLIGTVLLVVSPRYPWYALLLLPFIAMSGRWEWLAVPMALLARQLLPSTTTIRVAVAIAIAVVVGVWLVRRRRSRTLARTGPDSVTADG